MSRGSTLILLGVLMMLVPFSGLPASFRTFLAVALGIIVLSAGFTLRSHDTRPKSPPPAE